MNKTYNIYFLIYIILFSVNTVKIYTEEAPLFEQPVDFEDTANSAEEWEKAIGFGAGISLTGYYDETNSLNKTYSNAATLIIFGNFENKKLLHSFNFNFFWGDALRVEPYKGYIQVPCSSIRGQIDYSFVYNLFERTFYSLYTGGTFRTLAHYTGPVIDSEIKALNPTGVVLFSLDLNLSQKFIFNDRNFIFFSMRLPIVGYAIRPPYAGLDGLWQKYQHEETYYKFISVGELISFHNYFAITGEIKYNFKINQRFAVYSAIGFDYSFISFHRSREDIILALNAGITILF